MLTFCFFLDTINGRFLRTKAELIQDVVVQNLKKDSFERFVYVNFYFVPWGVPRIVSYVPPFACQCQATRL